MKIKSFLLSLFLFSTTLINAGSANDAKPASEFAADYQMLLAFVENRLVQLAEATPQDKMTWRPGDGVRSVSEVYLHIAQSTQYVLSFLGEEIPAELNVDPKVFESSTTDKAAIVKLLKDSFGYYKAASIKVNDEKLNTKVKFFGNDSSVRLVLEAMLNHVHEHFGQSIAYARMVGVTPPWSMNEN
ncbi:MAG: DinB family protein [Melioribacteraceae bacterium]|nr:MAG: DinB family protein [Melioribacteraceae bacterium]